MNNQKVKNYYRDSGKGLGGNNLVTIWGKARGFPSYLYQRKRILDTIEEIKSLKLKKKVLDAACGSGYILSHLPRKSVGIEINPRHVKAARENAPFAEVIKGDIEKIPFTKNYFSASLATEIFEHLPDSKKPISELWRTLKKGGILIVTVPRNHLLWRLRFLASSMYVTEPQCLTFSKKTLLSMFEGKKYKIKRFKKIAFGLNYILVLEKEK